MGGRFRACTERFLSCRLLAPFFPLSTGLGTWAWGNKLVWGYDDGMDVELQEAFDLCVSEGINWFDTADSYG